MALTVEDNNHRSANWFVVHTGSRWPLPPFAHSANIRNALSHREPTGAIRWASGATPGQRIGIGVSSTRLRVLRVESSRVASCGEDSASVLSRVFVREAGETWELWNNYYAEQSA